MLDLGLRKTKAKQRKRLIKLAIIPVIFLLLGASIQFVYQLETKNHVDQYTLGSIQTFIYNAYQEYQLFQWFLNISPEPSSLELISKGNLFTFLLILTFFTSTYFHLNETIKFKHARKLIYEAENEALKEQHKQKIRSKQ